MPVNSWSHIAFVFDADSAANVATFYLDGVPSALTASSQAGSRISGAGENLAIGNVVAADRTFDGIIGEIVLYD